MNLQERDLQERYDELDNIVQTLDNLISDTSDENYIEQLRATMYEAQDELNDVEKQLQKQYEREERQQEYEYERSVL